MNHSCISNSSINYTIIYLYIFIYYFIYTLNYSFSMNHFQFQYQSVQKNQLHVFFDFPIFLRSPPSLSRRTRSQVRDARRQSGTGLSIYMYRGVRNDRSESMRPCIRVESVRDVPKEQTSDHVSFPSPSLEA